MEQRVSLLQEIFTDLMAYKWPLGLGILVLLNALSIVIVTHETRLLSVDHNRLLASKTNSKLNGATCCLNKVHSSEHSRVRQLAFDKLNMKRPITSDETLVILE